MLLALTRVFSPILGFLILFLASHDVVKIHPKHSKKWLKRDKVFLHSTWQGDLFLQTDRFGRKIDQIWVKDPCLKGAKIYSMLDSQKLLRL